MPRIPYLPADVREPADLVADNMVSRFLAALGIEPENGARSSAQTLRGRCGTKPRLRDEPALPGEAPAISPTGGAPRFRTASNRFPEELE